VTGAESLVVPYTESRGHPASAAGLLLAIAPAGILIGDLVIVRFCVPVTRQRLAFPLALLTGAPLVALVLSPPLPLVAVALFVSGFGFGYALGIQQAFLDSLPADLRGQGFGLNTTGTMSGQGLTPPVTGAVATMLGPALTMAAAGAACVGAVICLRGPLSGRRRLPAEVGAAVDVDHLAGDVTGLR
jgi:predicted MFS family arabinose efflux permease